MLRIKLFTLLISGFLSIGGVFAQHTPTNSLAPEDTVKVSAERFTPASASAYIHKIVSEEKLWRDQQDTLRFSLQRLVDHFNEPFDSVDRRLRAFPFLGIAVKTGYVLRHDTLPVRWLSQNQFIIDTILLDRNPVILRQTIVMTVIDSLSLPNLKMLPELMGKLDSLIQARDTITERFIDLDYLKLRNIRLYERTNGQISPSILPANSRKSLRFTADSSKVVITESVSANLAGQDSPFKVLPGLETPDSLKLAVETLLNFTVKRDSVLLYLNDVNGNRTPFWLSAGEGELVRFWVKNAKNDSITIWMGNPTKYDLALILEDDVYVERLGRKTTDELPISGIQPSKTLATIKPLAEIPIHWEYGLTNSFSLNQNFLSNWARGGESSLSGMLDINARARYTNKESKEQWTNSARLRFGTIGTIEPGFKVNNIRTSTDIFEVNSQYNRRILDKFDFSSILYFKTQLAKGFRAPNFDDPVSKFLSPGAITIGSGFEYKPSDKTQLNFSVLTYRNTFVLDTVLINQTLHGVDKDKRSRQELGGQLMIRNTFKIKDNMTVTNAVRLFSSYLNKPQNVDVDWEMSIERQISYLFSIRLNIHLIYDDDIRFPVLDAAGQPVLLPDGSPRKVPRTQLNQFMGLTFSFRL